MEKKAIVMERFHVTEKKKVSCISEKEEKIVPIWKYWNRIGEKRDVCKSDKDN